MVSESESESESWKIYSQLTAAITTLAIVYPNHRIDATIRVRTGLSEVVPQQFFRDRNNRSDAASNPIASR